jgi:hypothetical protein
MGRVSRAWGREGGKGAGGREVRNCGSNV